MEADKITVNTPNEAYESMAVKWRLIDNLMGGTLAMREAGREYLPQYAKESDARYRLRLQNSVLLEKFKDTVQTLSARPFGSPVALNEDADPFFWEIAENVDLTGRNMTVFARECMSDLLSYGKCHFMAEYPNTVELREMMGRDLTLADERQLKLRPYLVRISPSAIINWEGRRIGGVEQLTRLQVRHTIPIQHPQNEFAVEMKHLVVVWTRQRIVVWERISDEGEDEVWMPVDNGDLPNTLGEIPLVTVYANRKKLLTAEPPLEGLAHLNAKHWRNQSDQDNIEQVARVPMLFFRGFSKQDVASVEVGPFKVFGNQDPQSDVMVIETNGNAVKVGSDALREVERQMNVMSMSPMERRAGNPTATELAIEAGREVSDLEAYVMLLEYGLKQGLGFCAKWANRDAQILPDVLISEDLGYSVTSGRELEELREDFKLGVLDKRTYLEERKRRGLYHESVEVNDVLASLETENPFTELDIDEDIDEDIEDDEDEAEAA